MKSSDVSAHSDSEAAPLKRWFQDSYSREYLYHPQQSAFEHTSMSFHSPFKSPRRSHSIADYSVTPRSRFKATSLSPRYLSPIANRSGAAFEEEYVMGCSICGTKAIEDASWTYHDSPPHTRPSNRPELVDMDHENSGAYSKIISCRLHKAYSWLSDAVSMREIKLLEGKIDPEFNPFEVQGDTPAPGSGAQTTVVKEVYPSPQVPLTPLNYEDANLLKESLFHNPIAEKYVKEEERLRVVTRRAEYANRVKGFTRVVEATKARTSEDENEEFALQGVEKTAENQGFEPSYSDSLEAVRVQMEPPKDSYIHEGRKEPPLGLSKPGIPSEGPGSEELMEEKKREAVRVKVPSSFRNPVRHNTSSSRKDSESTPRSPAAESEDMTESTGQRHTSELAKKKLEEIKKTVKQRREERKSREVKQISPSSRSGLPIRPEGHRHLPGGSTKKFPSQEIDLQSSQSKDSLNRPVAESAGVTPKDATFATEKTRARGFSNPTERKSAVIGSTRLSRETQDQEPRSSGSSGKVISPPDVQHEEISDEELPAQPVMIPAEERPILDDSDAQETSIPERVAISPILATGAGHSVEQVPDDSQSLQSDHNSEGLKLDAEQGEEAMEAQEEEEKSEVLVLQTQSKPPISHKSAPQPPNLPLGKLSSGHLPTSGEPGSQIKSASGSPRPSPKLSPRPASEAMHETGFISKQDATIKIGKSQFPPPLQSSRNSGSIATGSIGDPKAQSSDSDWRQNSASSFASGEGHLRPVPGFSNTTERERTVLSAEVRTDVVEPSPITVKNLSPTASWGFRPEFPELTGEVRPGSFAPRGEVRSESSSASGAGRATFLYEDGRVATESFGASPDVRLGASFSSGINTGQPRERLDSSRQGLSPIGVKSVSYMDGSATRSSLLGDRTGTGDSDLFIEEVQTRQVKKSLGKQQRKKVSSAKRQDVASFHQLQLESVILIQRAARRFLAQRRREKWTQTDTEQYSDMLVGPI